MAAAMAAGVFCCGGRRGMWKGRVQSGGCSEKPISIGSPALLLLPRARARSRPISHSSIRSPDGCAVQSWKRTSSVSVAVRRDRDLVASHWFSSM